MIDEASPSGVGVGVVADNQLIVRVGGPRPAGAAVYIWRDVIEQLVESAIFEPETYRACVLFGGFAQSPNGGQLEIRGFVDLSRYASPRDVLADWLAEWERTRIRIGRAHGGAVPVGWASFRPGSGGVLDPDEQIVQRTFCALPWQVALVIDPLSSQVGLWGPQEDGTLANIGFNIVARNASRGQAAKEQT